MSLDSEIDSYQSNIYQTVCHNKSGGSKKLYYYDNSKTFVCYTNCGKIGDIYELVQKAKKEQGYDFSFYDSIKYVAEITGKQFTTSLKETNAIDTSEDWEILSLLSKKKDQIPLRKNQEYLTKTS